MGDMLAKGATGNGGTMQSFAKWLDGKKSIIGTIVLGVIGILASAGTIHLTDQWVQVVTLLVAVFTGISFRAAIAKSGLS
jgi:hypothetical protein